MKEATENQGSTRTLAENLSPRSKDMDFALQQNSLPHFTSFPQETPIKQSQVSNWLSHHPTRRVLPLQTPEQCNKDRCVSNSHPPYLAGSVHSGLVPVYSPYICSPLNHLPKDRLGPPKYYAQPPGPPQNSPANFGTSAYQPFHGILQRFGAQQHTVQSGPGHFPPPQLVPAGQIINDTSSIRPSCPSSFHTAPSHFVKNLNHHSSTCHTKKDQEAESKVHSFRSGINTETSQRKETNKIQQHEPSNEHPISAEDLNCTSQKRDREFDNCYENAKKLCHDIPNSANTKATVDTSDNPSSTSQVSQLSLKYASVLEQSPKTTESHVHTELACGQSTSSEISSTLKPSRTHCTSSPKDCTKKEPSFMAKQYIYSIQNNIVSLSSHIKPSEENVKTRNEESHKREKITGTDVPQNVTGISLSIDPVRPSSGNTPCSTSVLPVKTLNGGDKVGESRKTDNKAPKTTSKSNLGTSSCRSVENSKTKRTRRVVVPDDIDQLFTPDPKTYVVSPACKTAKPKIDGETIKLPISEKASSPASGCSPPVSGSSCHKTPLTTVTESPHGTPPSKCNSPVGLPSIPLKRVKLEKLSVGSKDKGLINSSIASSERKSQDNNVQTDEKHKPPDSNYLTSSSLRTDAASSEQTSSSHCTQSHSLERQASEGCRKEANEEDPMDGDLDLGLSFEYTLDVSQSSDSSEEEQLISLQEMMERVAKPPPTPEKGAFSEPSTPGRKSSQSKTVLPPAVKSGVYKNNLDQMLEEINNNKKAKEVEAQLLTACKEDLLVIAEYEASEEHQEEDISTEQQEFLQRYSLMSSAIREVPPGEVVFNLERFGCIFDQNTLQLRQCMVSPQGTAQKALLWSSPAQLRLHVIIGLFQEAYDYSSPCPPQVCRFLFKMMSVHSERMVSEKILQALSDIACSAAYQIGKNGSQQFEVWVPSLADVTLVLMNMGIAFVTLFPFENLQPLFTERDLLEEVKSESPSAKEHTVFPERNCNIIFKYLSYCMGLCPRAYSDDELLLLLTMVGRVSLDTRRILQSTVEVSCLQYKIINNIRNWDAILPRICLALTDLTDDHHNMCLLVQLLPDNTRGKQLRRHLSLSMISKLLDGNCTYRPTQKEFQLADLRPYLPRMQPSTLLRGLHQNDKEEDMATLDQQAYYLCHSLLTLTNEASNFQFFPAHQKAQLLVLSSELETHVKCDIRESEKCLYRSKVKDLVARIYTKWQMLLQRTRPLNGKLYDYWQPVGTFGSSQDDGENTGRCEDADDEEEKTTITYENDEMVVEGEEKKVETLDAEEDMELYQSPEDNEGDSTEDDMSNAKKAAQAVGGDCNQVMPEMLPQAVDEQKDTDSQECSGAENETS